MTVCARGDPPALGQNGGAVGQDARSWLRRLGGRRRCHSDPSPELEAGPIDRGLVWTSCGPPWSRWSDSLAKPRVVTVLRQPADEVFGDRDPAVLDGDRRDHGPIVLDYHRDLDRRAVDDHVEG